MRTWAPVTYVLAAALLTAAGAVVHGRLTARWLSDQDQGLLADSLRSLPHTCGEWELSADIGLSTESVRMLQCAAQRHVIYRHRLNGTEVAVTVIAGPPGPTSVHTPEVCFPSQNYKLVETRRRQMLDRDAFWCVDFEANDANLERTRVYYAWSDGRSWQAPEQARFEFAGRPWLYKLQVSSTRVHGSARDACQEFLPPFLAQLRSQLAPTT